LSSSPSGVIEGAAVVAELVFLIKLTALLAAAISITFLPLESLILEHCTSASEESAKF